MQSDNGNTPDHGPTPPAPAGATATRPDPGLPPVAPPSGTFILQLFLVPGLIIAACLGIYLLMSFLFGSALTAAKFKKRLSDDNPEVRWRAAEDLARVLPGRIDLATDVDFGLFLAERLEKFAAAEEKSERDYAERLKKDKDLQPPKALLEERKFVLYLTSALGHFRMPVGAPLLKELARRQGAGDAETAFRRRSIALLALANLGSNLSKFDGLDELKRKEILGRLAEEA